MVQTFSEEALVRHQASRCEMCVIQSGTETGFSPSTSVFLPHICPPAIHSSTTDAI